MLLQRKRAKSMKNEDDLVPIEHELEFVMVNMNEYIKNMNSY